MNNLSYETARALKDAGFPFEDISDEIRGHRIDDREPRPDIEEMSKVGFVGGGRIPFVVFLGDAFSVFKIPTLSELIEAVGGGFFKLIHTSTDVLWTAETLTAKGTGKTPEEAVANLYLALHNK